MKPWTLFNPNLLLAILIPFIACGLQWILWDRFISPYVWFLFFPAAFFSAWIGGLRGGLISTVTSAALVWYVYIQPRFSMSGKSVSATASTLLFITMGILFALMFKHLSRAHQRTSDALNAAEAARQEAILLYEKTLELDRLKSQFFANVSHELRTPLTLIMAPLQNQLQSDSLSAAARQEVEMMLRNARILYRHVCDLLDSAKLEAGNVQLQYSRFDITHLARTMAAYFDSSAQDRRIALHVTGPDSLIVEADAAKLERMLLNLLSNAFKFTPEGGQIVVQVSRHEEDAVLSVEDSGPGVPVEFRSAVFERFRQLDGGSQRRYGGTGLGLAIVKEFAILHRGEAQVMEAPSGGALFTIRLPLKAPESTSIGNLPFCVDEVLERQALDEVGRHKPQQARSTGLADSVPLILVVEDNIDMNTFIIDTLKTKYRVASAWDGLEGLEKVHSLKPDLILSDVMMPGMSGDEMVLELRKYAQFADVPVVLLTAKADDELRVSMFQAGVQGYLAKPFSVDELLARVGGLLENRQQALQQRERSENALTRMRLDLDRLRFALDHVNSYVFIKDRNLRYVYANQLTLSLFGCTQDELVGKGDEQFFPASALERIREIDMRALGGHNTQEQVCIERGDGDCRWYIDVKSPLFGPESSTIPIALLGISTDITDRIQIEEEVKSLNSALERRVVERTAELTVANQELDAFAYSVSHDLRAPLRAISGFTAVLEEDYGRELTQDAHKYLGEVVKASNHMGTLIDGLLKLAHTTRGDLQREEVNLSYLAEEYLTQLRLANPDRVVNSQVEPRMIAEGDRAMLSAVMQNLIGNAWKYSATTAEAWIRIYEERRGNQKLYCVADNGAGFDMKYASNLYKPFKRLHRSEEFPGIGLGLATVQRIVRRHGGDISATGEPGMGATFCFSLTAETSEPQEAPQA